jgi:hypothetical protein
MRKHSKRSEHSMWPLLILLILGTRTVVRRLTIQQLRDLAKRSGFPPESIDVAAAVAMAESGGRPEIQVHEPNGTWSFGLWQINSVHGHSPSDLFDPDYNARTALELSKGGTDWHLWSAFKNGDYRRYLTGG